MSKAAKRRFGDRFEGRRIRTLDPNISLTPFIMKDRSEASNYFSDSIDITETERFIRDKRLKGYPGLGLLHVFIAAYIRVASQYPGVNRFISGRRMFSRNNIEFIMLIKKELRTDSSETSIKVIFDPSDTISDVYVKLGAEINKAREAGETTDSDDAAKTLMMLPRFLLKLAVRCIRILDYFGMLPKSLLKASPFHGSMMITDLGSIGLPAIHHHLYNIGNLPMFISIGAKRKDVVLRKDGSAAQRKLVDYAITMDERICDGFYFSQVFRLFKGIILDPGVLDEPPETVKEDVD